MYRLMSLSLPLSIVFVNMFLCFYELSQQPSINVTVTINILGCHKDSIPLMVITVTFEGEIISKIYKN